MRLMMRFDFPGNSYGFWSGIEPFVFEGVTYVGAGSLITIDD